MKRTWVDVVAKRIRQGVFVGLHPGRLRTLRGELRALGLNLLPGHRFPQACGIQKLWYPYLSTQWGPRDRLEALICHYQRWRSLGLDAHQEVPLVRSWVEGQSLEIVLTRVVACVQEGECVLEYRLDGVVVYRLAFSLVPGRLLDPLLGSEVYVLIGGSQGTRGGTEDFRRATKLNSDVAPTTLTFVALQALAQRLDVAGIAGIKAQYQVSDTFRAQGLGFHPMYDALWTFLGGEERSSWFLLPTGSAPKDLSLVPRKHRQRARRRREVRAQVQGRVLVALEGASQRVPATRPEPYPLGLWLPA